MALNRRLSAFCNDRLPHTLEQLFDRFVPSDRHLYVPLLTLDLGTVSLHHVEDEVADALVIAVTNALRALSPVSVSPRASHSHAVDTVQSRSHRDAIIDAFVHFARTGRLPWWFQLPAATSLEEALLAQVQPDGRSIFDLDGAAEAIRSLLVTLPQARQRMVGQFSERFRLLLVRAFSQRLHESIIHVLDVVRQLDTSATLARHFERAIWLVAFSLRDDAVSPDALATRALRALSPAVDETTRVELGNAITAVWKALAFDVTVPQRDDATQRYDASTVTTNRVRQPAERMEPLDSEEFREGVFVENAGLVILHPFLPRLFSALEIANDERMLRPDRALVLLHFLASGSTTAPEYELVLPKVMCGIPIDDPIEFDVVLSPEELEEAQALLEAIITHWSALRSTTPDGLRGAFLMRRGKLSMDRDGERLLQVERRTHDLLVAQLPWSISMFRLPWMEQLCRVEWG